MKFDPPSIRQMLEETDDEIDWVAVSDAQVEIIGRLGPTRNADEDPIALIVIGLSTMHADGFDSSVSLIMLCATIVKRIMTDPEGQANGREFIDEFRKAVKHGR